ncbi:MAG: hypothetical protein ACRDRN_01495 [Sciscionella sp.]
MRTAIGPSPRVPANVLHAVRTTGPVGSTPGSHTPKSRIESHHGKLVVARAGAPPNGTQEMRRA